MGKLLSIFDNDRNASAVLPVARPEPSAPPVPLAPPAPPAHTPVVEDTMPGISEDVLAPFLRGDDQRLRDHRRHASEVPWLTTIKLPWGPEVALLNISRTGMLIETTFKFTSGTVIEFQLCGSDVNLVVRAKVVRCEIASVDSRSVRYHAAAVFSEELRLNSFLGREKVSSPPKALADLLTHVASDLERSGYAGLRTRFEQGLKRIVGARDVQLRDGVMPLSDTDESIYFKVPSTIGNKAILQITFAPGHELLEMEFRLLQSAATLAALVLEFEKMPLAVSTLVR